MKTLKWIGIVLLSVTILVIIASFVLPTEYSVERKISIRSAEDQVFKGINNWSEFAQWSPWNDLDSAMEVKIEGVDGTVGSVYHWKGNDAAGSGKMVKTEVVPNQRITYDLIFTEPFESKAESWMSMAPDQNGVEVLWGMKGEMNRPLNLMLAFMDMEGAIGKDFEKGLLRIKEKLESAPTFIATEVLLPEMNLIFVRRNTDMNSIMEVTKTAFNDLERFTSMSGLEITGAPMALYESWTEEAIKVLLAYPVKMLPESLQGDFQMMTMQQTPTLMATYKGDYDLMPDFYNQFMTFIESNGYDKTDFFIEEYVNDPKEVQDKSLLITNVYFEIKPKALIQ